MMRPGNKKGGFTLLEVVLSLILAGIIGTIAGLGLVQFTKGFIFAKRNTVTAQKGQMTTSRLMKEFGAITSILSSPAPTAFSITYSRNPSDPTDTHTVASTGGTGPVTLDGDTLTDQVQSFRLDYYTAYNDTSSPATYSAATIMIQITLELVGADNVTSQFVSRVFLYGLVE